MFQNKRHHVGKAQPLGAKRPRPSALDGSKSEAVERAREVMLNMPRPAIDPGRDVFKVPPMPQAKIKGKSAEDLFLADATMDGLEKANKLVGIYSIALDP